MADSFYYGCISDPRDCTPDHLPSYYKEISVDIKLISKSYINTYTVPKGLVQKNLNVILKIIDAYEKVKPNLDKHAPGYPEADYLRSISCLGIPVYGERPGKGFADEKYNDNPGVNRIIAAADKEDDRPLWIGLGGGANTLVQAVWKVWKTRSEANFNKFLSKLRIYGISDQDKSSLWMREMFGDRLFYIVTPSRGTMVGGQDFIYAAWPGMSSDNFYLGSNDGKKGGGFQGARTDLISKEWIKENISSHGVYGAYYPLPHFSMEGDTQSYLGLIPNGLNDLEHPDYGSWGGRYRFYKPEKSQFMVEEKFPIWTNSSDTVRGIDGNTYTSPQSTIWRWREAFQNDFAARMADSLEYHKLLSRKKIIIPRIITNEANLDRFLKLVDKYSAMGRIHFMHIRNVKLLDDGSFEESAHFSPCGSLDIVEIVKALYKNNYTGYVRPDHGRMIWGETGRRCNNLF